MDTKSQKNPGSGKNNRKKKNQRNKARAQQQQQQQQQQQNVPNNQDLAKNLENNKSAVTVADTGSVKKQPSSVPDSKKQSVPQNGEQNGQNNNEMIEVIITFIAEEKNKQNTSVEVAAESETNRINQDLDSVQESYSEQPAKATVSSSPESPTKTPKSSPIGGGSEKKKSGTKMIGIKSAYGSSVAYSGVGESNICKICNKHVYHMEQIKAVKSVFHKSCFRCVDCSKQLNVDSYSSHEGLIYCKPHFKKLFQPKPHFDNNNNHNGNHEINGNGNTGDQSPVSSIDGSSETGNVTFTNGKSNESESLSEDKPDESSSSTVGRRDSIRQNKLIICENQPKELPPDVVRYDSKPEEVYQNRTIDLSNIRNRFESGALSNSIDYSEYPPSKSPHPVRSGSENKIHKIMQKYQSRVAGERPVSSGSDEEDNVPDQCDSEKDKLEFSGLSSLKSQWETGSIKSQQEKSAESLASSGVENELAELRKKMAKSSDSLTKVYERAVQEAKSTENLSANKPADLDGSAINAGSIKEKFEKGARNIETDEDRIERLRKEREAEIMQIAKNDLLAKEARNKFKQIEAGIGKENHHSPNGDGLASAHIEDLSIDSQELQQRFSYFENLPTATGAVADHESHSSIKAVDDIPKVDTTKKMLNKFKALESSGGAIDSVADAGNPGENPVQDAEDETDDRGPKIVKSIYKNECVIPVETAKNLRVKFENWQNEIKRENRKNLEDESDFIQLEPEATKNIRAMFESIQNDSPKTEDKPRPRVNRFVEKLANQPELCSVCKVRIYLMEKLELTGAKLHKKCFRCTKCHKPLEFSNYTQHADKFYCLPHFKQLFMEKGNYDEGFGLEQHKDKWSNKNNMAAKDSHKNGENGKSIDEDNKIDGIETTNGNGHHHDDNESSSTYDAETLDSLEANQPILEQE